MKNIFGYLKQSGITVAVIVMLLVIQVYCDLALPTYTADIVDVGISKGGIDVLIPDRIRESELQKLLEFVPDSDRKMAEDAYQDKGKKTERGETVLERSVSGREYQEAEEVLKAPVMIYGLIVSMQNGTYEQTDMGSFDMKQIKSIQEVLFGGESGNEEKVRAVEQVVNMFGPLADNMMETLNTAYISNEYEACGINMNRYQRNYLLLSGVKMLGIAFIGMVVAITVGMLASRVAAGTAMRLRNQMFRKVVGFSNAEMDRFSTASLITRSTNDIQQVQMVIVMLLRMVLFAPIMAIGGIIKVIGSNADMSFIIVIAVLMIFAIVGVLVAVAMPKFKAMQDLVDRVNLVAREILTGLPVIRAFCREKYEEERFDRANVNLKKTQLFVNRVMAFMMPAMTLVMNGITLAILWFGAKRIDQGTMQVGEMTAFITYTMQIVMSFLMLTMVSIMLPRAAVAATRVDEVLNTPVSIKDKDNVVPLPEKGKGYVEFDRVSFRYPNAEQEVLENITFTAKPGETTAIIGSTGSGKSTLVNLIPRFYDVTEGSIKIDGTDIRDIAQKDLRGMLGYVPQKGTLFSGDIASNLRFGKEDASDGEIERAARIAQATEFIEQKENQYHSAIAQGGTNVSGGQKQRLSIARAIAKDPQIYIFDDSFSALDYKTDVTLRKALSEEIAGRTLIIVAQRISTILHAEQIIVLDEGKIVGKGTHEELLETCDVYRQIAISQLSEEEISHSVTEEKGGIV